MIGLRLPKDEAARLDQWAKANGYTRSEAIRVLIERGLPRDPAQPAFKIRWP
jgi:predicted DNA-binding protein